ncbi:hypothetical protein SAMN05216359_104141 [Roseateles sp. YR242]|uniref:hypothetical protein n=1 Tax=Roseateles sp. YR242 TaxID=1855305 RepID=UPI0008D08111|nr:hypothetical protein [Roseateles sp. YR242]SEK96179.1 hypothetical protein SAMN05216359_104141 [Roseateles sp. YR242]
MPASASAFPSPSAPSSGHTNAHPLRVELHRTGLRIGPEAPVLRSRLLPRLLAALLQAHDEGFARRDSPCSRADLCARIAGMAELHRTQVWRAMAQLGNTPLQTLIAAQTPSGGPFWLHEPVLARCSFHLDTGGNAQGSELADWLGQRPLATGPGAATTPLIPWAYTEALARADHLLDRGELYPARLALQQAVPHLPPQDPLAVAALGWRRARIARRLGDWGALQDELRDLSQTLNDPRLPAPERLQLNARIAILAAWHWYGSLGQPAAALARLDEVPPAALAFDPTLRCDHGNLRGIALRELALAQGDTALAAAAIATLGDALRSASLAGLPDALQICAANLAHGIGQLAHAELLGTQASIKDALRWLLLSDAICTRWQLGRSSLLNTIFLLRLATLGKLRFSALRRLADEAGQPLQADSYAALAAHRWEACRGRQSQIPADQRCAFLLLWARHAAAECDSFSATDLVRQARLQARKLRDPQARQRYLEEADELTRQPQRA